MCIIANIPYSVSLVLASKSDEWIIIARAKYNVSQKFSVWFVLISHNIMQVITWTSHPQSAGESANGYHQRAKKLLSRDTCSCCTDKIFVDGSGKAT